MTYSQYMKAYVDFLFWVSVILAIAVRVLQVLSYVFFKRENK